MNTFFLNFLIIGSIIFFSSMPINPSSPECGLRPVIPIFGFLIFQILFKELLKIESLSSILFFC